MLHVVCFLKNVAYACFKVCDSKWAFILFQPDMTIFITILFYIIQSTYYNPKSVMLCVTSYRNDDLEFVKFIDVFGTKGWSDK